MSDAAAAQAGNEGAGGDAAAAAAAAAATGAESQAAAAGAESVSGDSATDSVAAAAGADSVSGADGSDLVRPEGLPDELWDPASGVKVGDLWSAYRDLKAATDAAKADVPDSPEGYELAISDAVKVPDGFKVDIDPKDPFFADVTKEAHALGLGKAGVQKLVDAYARAQIAEQTAATEVYAGEKTKLGENAEARIKAVDDWLTANLTKEEAAALASAKVSATHVRAFEKIIKLRSDATAAQGGANNVTALEGLRGGDMLDAIRTQAA